jgi:hypothetical protein
MRLNLTARATVLFEWSSSSPALRAGDMREIGFPSLGGFWGDEHCPRVLCHQHANTSIVSCRNQGMRNCGSPLPIQ